MPPADPSQTPQISPEEIQKQMRESMQQGMQNMDPKQKKMMEFRYKQGPGPSAPVPTTPEKN